MDALYLVGIAVLAVFGFVFAVILFNFFGVWLRARIANAPVGMGKMVGMRLRRVPVGLIVDSRITAVKAGIEIPTDPLEAHFLAGGDVSQVILALIAADKAMLLVVMRPVSLSSSRSAFAVPPGEASGVDPLARRNILPERKSLARASYSWPIDAPPERSSSLKRAVEESPVTSTSLEETAIPPRSSPVTPQEGS